MITVEEAKAIVIGSSNKLNKSFTRKIYNCSGYFTSENIHSPLDLPPFDQSNVDGYVSVFSNSNSRKITGEIKAGDNPRIIIKSGECARIFTGAVVPKGSDFVVMQEDVIRNQNRMMLNDVNATKNDLIRKRGSHIRKGELAVTKGTYINPAVSGFLAALGIEKVKVFRKPEISLLITGNELQTPGEKLKFGKVYDSNSFIISSALEKMGLNARDTIFNKDEKDILKKNVSELLELSDVILISGGVSVGKYDFVNEVLDELGVKRLFYKVSQRPGKPLYFGKKDSTYIFGLPGNPASVFTCFYEYVYPLLRKLQGFSDHFLQVKYMTAVNEINKKFKMANFLKAKTSGSTVESLEGQASYILRTFAEADSFIYLPADKFVVRKDEEAEVHMFPY